MGAWRRRPIGEHGHVLGGRDVQVELFGFFRCGTRHFWSPSRRFGLDQLLPGAKWHAVGVPAFWHNEVPLKRPAKSTISNSTPGTRRKAVSSNIARCRGLVVTRFSLR